MSNRRSFIKLSISGLMVSSILSPEKILAEDWITSDSQNYKIRFAIASDGHYGQPNSNYHQDHKNLVSWLKRSHSERPLDLIIINGDLTHDRPDLLPELRSRYLDALPAKVYTVPGNHDRADGRIWKENFGYEDNHSFIKNGIGFILANTANPLGGYCPPNIHFLQRELERMKPLHIVFVILHIPPYIWQPENPFVDSPETITLLHEYTNVKAVFHGHDHNLDSVLFTGGLPHFFDAHISGNWGTEYRGFRIVEVNSQNEINTWQVNASESPILNRFAIRT